MSKWINFSIDERKAIIQGVVSTMQIDEAAAEKDWWVTAVLYALFHTKAGDYLLFKGGTSLSKGWNIIDRFSEDIDLALGREFFLNNKNLSCANCTSNTQIHNLRKKFYHVGYVDYDKELPETITIVPREELVSKYEEDYNDMRSSFIYGGALEFSDLLKFLKTLQERFRKIPPRE